MFNAALPSPAATASDPPTSREGEDADTETVRDSIDNIRGRVSFAAAGSLDEVVALVDREIGEDFCRAAQPADFDPVDLVLRAQAEVEA